MAGPSIKYCDHNEAILTSTCTTPVIIRSVATRQEDDHKEYRFVNACYVRALTESLHEELKSMDEELRVV